MIIFIFFVDCGKMSSIPQGAFAAWKVRCNDEYAVSISAMEKKEKTEEKKENIFTPRPPLEGNIFLFGFIDFFFIYSISDGNV